MKNLNQFPRQAYRNWLRAGFRWGDNGLLSGGLIEVVLPGIMSNEAEIEFMSFYTD